jgi:uncharacterized protein
MVTYTRLVLVLASVVTLIAAALIIQVRWIRRYLRQRAARGLGRQALGLSEQLRGSRSWQRWRERSLYALGVAAIGCVGWGFVEPNWVQITEHRVTSPKLLPGSSIRVIHLSDLHSEAKVHVEPEVVSKVAELRPDLIVFTGDAINEERGLPVFRATMTALAKIAPTYAVRGNWETWWFPNLDLYGGTGVHPSDGRAKSIVLRGQRVWLVGVGVDRENQLTPALGQVQKGGFTILLHHFVALAPRAAKQGVDLMLAGDTHGGQARLPLLGEVVRISRRGIWRSSGMHREGSMWLYVNRGLGGEGGIPRFRFGCRPEITVLRLEAP